MAFYRAFCLFSPPFLPLFASLCSSSNIGRSTLASCEFCNACRAQSAIIYFAIAINKSRCNDARSRDLIASVFISLFIPNDIKTYYICNRSIMSRSCSFCSRIFSSPLPPPPALHVHLDGQTYLTRSQTLSDTFYHAIFSRYTR